MNQYIVETNEYISQDDLKNIRTLYLPIIGNKAVSLYHSLVDEAIETFKVDFRHLSALMNSLQFNKEDLLSARKTLEAVGLIRTFSQQERSTFLFSISKPLDIKKMQNNKLLLNKLRNAIGEVELERIIFENRTQTIDKSGYVEISAKYHEIFEIELTTKIQKTSEISIPSFENKEDAMKGLSAEMFAKFLTNELAGPTLAKTFDSLRGLGFSNQSLNVIQNYSYEVNNKIVAKYVETIAYDFYKSDITSSSDIEKELSKASASKKHEVNVQPTSEIISEGGDISLDEIFSDLFS
ncbi:hypothetical protein [Mycoplasma todarodis]|uniref:Replicative helicase loading/DNA remodeling protein DnaB N-terminal winged helix domain-containing protein n=1 Tax=Mycoplasma todarodis TaxID=1937191 RepID=A0A4R0XUR4_9MOLU|nr:hypothetical protein [Mycoplasma todarodis]TCG10631.1 hypothetical protein C4B25_03420 [Mycoplasma todarodis]